MNKIYIGIALIGVAVLSLGAVGYVYAQTQTPPGPSTPFGPGMMGGYGHSMMEYGNGWMGHDEEEGPMHKAMAAAFADALGLSAEDIEIRHEAGETLWEIAAAEGLSDEEIRDVMDAAHDSALEDAVSQGWLTESQAEWMQGRMEHMWNNNGSDGGFGGHCGGGWQNGNNTGISGMGY